MMAATLGRASVGPNEDFFLLGGHSLLAMDLMARLRKAFGVEIPPSVLFENANVSELSKYIAEHQPKPAERPNFHYLVPIQRGDPDRTPLFLVAGGWGGEIEFLVYAQIGRLLDPLQPIWGLKARGAGTADAPHATVTHMAADYLAEIRSLQPIGPYWIAGECVGGICAHEMACQLRDAGEEVAGLILLDTTVPNEDELSDYLAEEERKRAAEAQHLTLRQRIGGQVRRIASGPLTGKFGKIVKKALGSAQPAANPHPRGQSEYPPTLMRHRLRPYPGRVNLLIDDESFTFYGHLGWEKAAIGGLDLHVLPGTHLSYIREEGTHAARKLQEIMTKTMHGR
jgi:thioesterase domain-containing protein/acyl carrier protein